jgi:hypothetical protein
MGIAFWLYAWGEGVRVEMKTEEAELRANVQVLEQRLRNVRLDGDALAQRLATEQANLGRLRDEGLGLEQVLAGSRSDVTREWLGRLRTLRGAFRDHPEWAIPELRLLSNRDWIMFSETAWPVDDDGWRKKLADVRTEAKQVFWEKRLWPAIKAYNEKNPGVWPASVEVFFPYLTDKVDRESLRRFAVVAQRKNPKRFMVLEKTSVDKAYDTRVGVKQGGQSVRISGVDGWEMDSLD